jgi:hypothetical protein
MNAADLIIGGHGERVSDPAEVIPALIECITSEEKRFARKLPTGM